MLSINYLSGYRVIHY